MSEVRLTDEECAVAEFVAKRTQAHVRATGARNRLNGRVTSLVEEIAAAAATLAAAKVLNQYPTFLEGRYASADVGLDVQVRSTVHERGHLIVHPEDPLDHRFVLVIVCGDGLFSVRGALAGQIAARYEARIDAYGHRGYWVPQASLDALTAERTDGVRASSRRGDTSWLCSDCRRQVALRDGRCGACWLTAWSEQ